MKTNIFCPLFFGVLLISCHPQDNLIPVINNEEIQWGKVGGKIVAFDGFYAFVADGNKKQIDTILKQPTNVAYGKYSIYGSKGITYSLKTNAILYTVFTDLPKRTTVNSIQLDGANINNIVLNPSVVLSISSPVENSDGAKAYFTSKNSYSDPETLWLDKIKIFTFSSKLFTPYNHLDWHPKNKFLLLSLFDETQFVPPASIYEMTVADSSFHEILKASNGTTYLSAHYSPNGNKVLFRAIVNRNEKPFTICTVNRDGTNFKELIECGFESYPVWSPNGDKIAYTIRGKGIYIINADGTDNTLVFKANPNKWIGDKLVWLP